MNRSSLGGRSRVLLLIVALPGALCVAGALSASRSPGERAIAPDPAISAPTAKPIAEPSSRAGLAITPTLPDSDAKRIARKPVPPKLEPIDPWDGEDLTPQLELAIASRPRLEFDRHDPWEPTKIYGTDPNRGGEDLDRKDPWVNRPGVGEAVATKAKVNRLRRTAPTLTGADEVWPAM